MSDSAIQVQDLGKQYRLGEERRATLREDLSSAWAAGLGRLRRGKRDGGARDGTIWALREVSFEVAQGEVVGIIGRNGAGKTTLLKVLARITAPTRGRAVLDGRVGSLLEVGTGFHPELTGRENIYLNGAILGMRRAEIERKFDEIVAFAEIEDFLDTPVKRYSSGMYVRLAFAIAAHLEPEILLVDEVLAFGDMAFQRKCLGKMGDVARAGRTILLVSHNMNAVAQLCSRAVLIERGRLRACGDTQSVIREYLEGQARAARAGGLDDCRREGGGRPVFTAARVNGCALPGEVVAITRGRLRIELEAGAGRSAVRDFSAGIHFHTEDGVRILSVATPWSSLGDIDVTGPFGLSCEIPSLPLIPGRYRLSIEAGAAGRGLDRLDDVCLLTVQPAAGLGGDAWPEYKTHGYYWADCAWSIERPGT